MPPAIQTAPAAPKSAAAAPTTGAPSPTQVFENKIAGQLQCSNQIDSRQSNLSTTVPKSGLIQWNHIRKHRGAQSPFFKKIPDSGSLIQSRIRVPHPGARLFAQKGGIASLPPSASIRKQNRWTTSTFESNRYPSTRPVDDRQKIGLNPMESNSYALRSPAAHLQKSSISDRRKLARCSPSRAFR